MSSLMNEEIKRWTAKRTTLCLTPAVRRSSRTPNLDTEGVS